MGNNVIDIDMYRARASTLQSSHPLENVNLGSLAGILKFVHTELLTEHEIYPFIRSKRRGDIDVIWKARYKVKNPDALVSYPKNGQTFATKVDFGPYINFENGQNKDAHSNRLIAQFGDYVGVQDPDDRRFPYPEPYYWFSLSGACPNLTFAEKYVDGAPNPQCMNYTNTSGLTVGPVLGGRCSGIPTGKPGCTYSHSEEQTVWLDDLAGITSEDCGGRLCTNWDDFRKNCANPAYKKKFDPQTNEPVDTDYCVEYDINPLCSSDCASEECQAVNKKDLELGLPFWQGRCDPKANRVRAERLAALFGITDAQTSHELVAPQVRKASQTCLHEGSHFCMPNPGEGGMFCTRIWDGVCQPCYIPGTKTEMPANQPLCPYDILEKPDYKGKYGSPDCGSHKAHKLCCLYLGTCTVGKVADPLVVPLNDDGLALMSTTKNTTALAVWLARVVSEGMGKAVGDQKALASFAYNEWSPVPRREHSLRKLQAELTKRGLVVAPNKTEAVTTTSVAAVVSDSSTPAPSVTVASTAAGESSGVPWWVYALAIAGLICCVGLCGGVIAYIMSRSSEGSDDEEEGQVSSKKSKKKNSREREPLTGDQQVPVYATPLMQSASGQPLQVVQGVYQLPSGQQVIMVQATPRMVNSSSQPILTVSQALPTYTVATQPQATAVYSSSSPLPSVRLAAPAE